MCIGKNSTYRVLSTLLGTTSHLRVYSPPVYNGRSIIQTAVFSMEYNFKLFPSMEKTKIGEHLYILTIYIGTFVAVDDKIH